MIFKWGDYDLPPPDKDGIQVTYEYTGTSRRKADHSLRVIQGPQKAQITVKWSGLPLEESDQINRALFNNLQETYLDLPDGQSFYVLLVDNHSRTTWFDYRDVPYVDRTLVWKEV